MSLDDRQMDAELGPRIVIEAAAAHVLHPPYLEVGNVRPVVDDAHQVSFTKSYSDDVTRHAVGWKLVYHRGRGTILAHRAPGNRHRVATRRAPTMCPNSVQNAPPGSLAYGSWRLLAALGGACRPFAVR